jgi:predicted anti-sigma-YlaC factor YlaD
MEHSNSENAFEGSTKMNCNDMNAKLPDLLFGPEEQSPEDVDAVRDAAVGDAVKLHLVECADCRKQLEEMRATMALLDAWEAPEPNPYFLTRLNARLDEERESAPASWYEKLRARLVYSSRLSLRPVAAMALTVAVLLGGGAYLGLNNWDQPVAQPPAQAAVVHDLQTLDNNAQLLDQLESLSGQNDD